MTRVWRRPRSLHVGIALAPDRVVAAIPGAPPTAAWTHMLTPSADRGVSRDLTRALGILRAIGEDALCSVKGERDEAHAPPAAVLHLALLPPLGHLTRLTLPHVRSDEALRRVRQEPTGYLPCWSNAGPLEIELAADTWRSSGPFTLFAAPRALVEGIHDAAQASGWRVAKLVSAHSAWAASAASTPWRRRRRQALVVCLADRVDVLLVRHGRLTGLRRLPAGAPDVLSLVEAAQAQLAGDRPRGSLDTTIVGDSPLATALRTQLAPCHAAEVMEAACLVEDAAIVAARFARRAARPVLYSEKARTLEAQWSRRRRAAGIAVATTLLGVAAAAESWAVGREQRFVERERLVNREQVARAMAIHDSVSSLTQGLALLREASASAPRWSGLILMLADRLPHEAVLTKLEADEESLHLEGSAVRAASVLETVRQLSGVRAVRFAGPIRQETKDGVITERFVLVATLGGQP